MDLKDLIKEKADILLISEEEQDYKELLELGFKRVDYFNSYMIAEDYFKNHPEQLDRYDLILEDHIASKSLCGDFNEDFLEHKIYQDTLSSLVNITRKNYFYRYEKNGILNVIIKELDHCETIKDEFIKRLTNKKSSPIKTTLPRVSKKPFPKQKKDLKILLIMQLWVIMLLGI